MASILAARPSPDADYRTRSKLRTAGLLAAIVGAVLATVTLINAIVAGNLVDDGGRLGTVAEALTWSFGLTTTAFGTVKFGIALVLAGILVRLWMQVDAVKAVLPALKPRSEPEAIQTGSIRTPHGAATVSRTQPKPLLIHRMARRMWVPMLVMGVMAVLAGFVLSLVATGNVQPQPVLAVAQRAWYQGLQFLGEGFLLAGVSFLLGSILAALRSGGGEVQESFRVAVKTLRMPATAKIFVGLMMLGLMVEIFQFGVYIYVATLDSPQTIGPYFTWLGPVRELGLGLLLSGIVLALAAIAKVLGFQFSRIREIITTGR